MGYSQKPDKMMEDDEPSFEGAIHRLTLQKNSRNPRAVRLAATTSAILDVVETPATGAQVYVAAVAALERTLANQMTHNESINKQIALLQLLSTVLPFVSPSNVLSATIVLYSRILRTLQDSVKAYATENTSETKDDLGNASVALKWVCRATTAFFLHVGSTADVTETKRFLFGTLIDLTSDLRDSVRQEAQAGVIELVLDTNRNPVVVKAISSHLCNLIDRVDVNDSSSLEQVEQRSALVERLILNLNYRKMFALLVSLYAKLRLTLESTTGAEYVTSSKVKDLTPCFQGVSFVLSVFLAMIETDAENKQMNEFVNKVAGQILSTLIQSKVDIVFRKGIAEYEVVDRTKLTFCQVVLSAVKRLAKENAQVASRLLPLCLQVVLVVARTNSDDSESFSEMVLLEVLQLLRSDFGSFVVESDEAATQAMLNDLLEKSKALLSWRSSTTALTCYALVIIKSHGTVSVEGAIETLAVVRDDDESPLVQSAIDKVVAFIAGEIGLEKSWGLVQFLASTDEIQLTIPGRVWVLDIFRKQGRSESQSPLHLRFFMESVLRIARNHDKRAAANGSEDIIFHRARVVDLWNLFPCFCRNSCDVDAVFSDMSKILIRALQDTRYPGIVIPIVTGLSELCKGHVAAKQASLANSAPALLPILFKLVTTPACGDAKSENQQQKQCIARAISNVARVCPPSHVEALFQKLMHKTLDAINTAENTSADTKCDLLLLAQALVASEVLEQKSVDFLFRVLKSFCEDDEHGARPQKRAYNVLLSICTNYHSFVVDESRVEILIDLLCRTTISSHVASRYWRLSCLLAILQGDETPDAKISHSLTRVLGEMLLCTKDVNKKTREVAFSFLETLRDKMDSTDYMNQIVAALGAESCSMRSAAVTALSRLIYSSNDSRLLEMIPSVLSLVLILIDEDSREVVKSVIGFIRVCVSVVPPESLLPLLPQVILKLLSSPKVKDRFRAKTKIILKKLIHRYGFKTLGPMVPESEQRLLTHMRKLETRRTRKSKALKSTDSFDDMIDSDEEDSDNGRTLMTGATGLTTKRSKRTMKSSAHLADNPVLPQETSEVVDMLSHRMKKKVIFFDDQVSEDSEDEIDFDDSGRLVVVEKEERIKPESLTKRRKKEGDARDAKYGAKKRMQELGSAYKSKRAGGDVKTKGQKYEPYAFVPLNGRSFSKRNRRTAIEHMSTVVSSKRRKREK